jgi:hypothetical protein
MRRLIEKCRNVPFYYWRRQDHKTAGPLDRPCTCFNHLIGLPKKGGREHPLYDYELTFFRALMEPSHCNTRQMTESERQYFEQKERDIEVKTLASPNENLQNSYNKFLKERENTLVFLQKVKHVALLKATSLGISEFCIRWLAWMCLRNDDLKGSQQIWFTGPRLELSISLVSRLRALFSNHGVTFDDKETVCNLNGVRIEAFPSHHADTARGLPNVSAIFIDEFSFVADREIDNIYDILLRNVPKSDPYLIVISTPQKINDAMYRIMNEPFETSIFKRLKMDWTYGIGKIFFTI